MTVSRTHEGFKRVQPGTRPDVERSLRRQPRACRRSSRSAGEQTRHGLVRLRERASCVALPDLHSAALDAARRHHTPEQEHAPDHVEPLARVANDLVLKKRRIRKVEQVTLGEGRRARVEVRETQSGERLGGGTLQLNLAGAV